ncbi:MAG: winged helix-turn-helix domain-containing protein [Nitrososphaerota archaeon]|nr:winged helix-turn-helix domain-containing protein [Nitrososphaerota archaeon]
MGEQTTHDPGPLERLFGSASATARVLDFMSTFDCYDYNKKDIADNSNVSQKHVKYAIEKLEEIGLIKKTRKIGSSELYQYNMNNQAAELLEKFSMLIAKHQCEKTTTKELKNQTLQQPNTQPIEA